MNTIADPEQFRKTCSELSIPLDCDEVRQLRSPYGKGHSALWDQMSRLDTEFCWHCGAKIDGTEPHECPADVNPADFTDRPAHKGYPGEVPCDHDWSAVDDSFDHEFGCEQVLYWRCDSCGATKQRLASDEFEEM